jgi:hypothetical protein
MKTPTTFTRSVTMPKRNDAGEILLDADKKPIDGEVLGAFTFKRPTLREEVMISTRFAELTGGQKRDNMSVRALDIATILAELPIVTTTVPDKWVWADLEGDGTSTASSQFGTPIRTAGARSPAPNQRPRRSNRRVPQPPPNEARIGSFSSSPRN